MVPGVNVGGLTYIFWALTAADWPLLGYALLILLVLSDLKLRDFVVESIVLPRTGLCKLCTRVWCKDVRQWLPRRLNDVPLARSPGRFAA